MLNLDSPEYRYQLDFMRSVLQNAEDNGEKVQKTIVSLTMPFSMVFGVLVCSSVSTFTELCYYRL